MGYVESNLMPNEKILHQATVHWIVYTQSVVWIMLAALTAIYEPLLVPRGAPQGSALVFPGVFLLLFLIALVKAMIYIRTTEFAVTNIRVIAKKGWLSHNVVELRHDKIEGLTMQQTMTGRLYNFGTLVLSGTGGDKTYIELIGHPSAFCNQAMQIITQKS